MVHGAGLNDTSARRSAVARIRQQGRYAEVFSAYMEEEPLIANWTELSTQPNVLVVPFFISDGLHSDEDIPYSLRPTAPFENPPPGRVQRPASRPTRPVVPIPAERPALPFVKG